ncbi:LOW QUALITY PROTEIN: ankyrin repeat domain-containing protein 33B [Osmerus mordax]|uniref:LOW QUALITY PROTEIN: ankyrin repeat domain-containing protein 33B n=1 Tax=Osmerus mordax TaxID=8014 RepID=UPI003510B38F
MATASHDPNLGAGPSDDSEISLDESESGSVLSDDSVMPDYEREDKLRGGSTPTLYEACLRNEALTLRRVLERGVTREEVMELDINGRNGLMLGVSKGYVDIVFGLYTCPMVDINHQDNDGNTALMIAAQAGFVTILNYILNYYPRVDLELRDTRGFTALIKASMQGRQDCVSALLMHGADINVVDSTKGKDIKDWALKTGRFEILQRLRRLHTRPVALQFCEDYAIEWPALKELVAKATSSKSAGQKLAQSLKDNLTFSFPRDPQDDGVLDHMVRMTTSLHSPLVATGTRPLCPTSPPEIGKRRLAVPELVAKHSSKELEESSVCHGDGSIASITPIVVTTSGMSLTCCNGERRESIVSEATSHVRSYLPRSLTQRNSVFPSGCIPKIQVTKSGEPTPKKEKKTKKQKGYLEPPVWKYKESKEEKKKERKKAEKEKSEQEKKDKRAKKKATK